MRTAAVAVVFGWLPITFSGDGGGAGSAGGGCGLSAVLVLVFVNSVSACKSWWSWT